MSSSASSGPAITQLPRRPGVGRLGKAIQVRSNYFEIQQLPNIRITHYDVTVTPDVPPPVNRKIFDQFITTFRVSDLAGSRPVYDGRKNLFSPKELPFESRTFEVSVEKALVLGVRCIVIGTFVYAFEAKDKTTRNRTKPLSVNRYHCALSTRFRSPATFSSIQKDRCQNSR